MLLGDIVAFVRAIPPNITFYLEVLQKVEQHLPKIGNNWTGYNTSRRDFL